MLSPDRSAWDSYHIDATHPQKLPALHCPFCGDWSRPEVSYPSIDLTPISISSIEHQGTLPITAFNDLIAPIKSRVPALPLSPGTEFGPLRGRARGAFGDFAWPNPWTPLLRESVWRKLRESRIDLHGAPADLQFDDPFHETFIELEAHPRVHHITSELPVECALCGRVTRPLDGIGIVLDPETFDQSIALQRVANLPSILIANEPFAKAILAAKYRDVIVNRVPFVF